MLAALVGAGALACTDTLAPDLVVPLQILATPDRDTLQLADSLVLTVRTDSLAPLEVVWIVEPRGDTARQTTFVYRPRTGGIEYVRARATFAGGRSGSAARRITVLSNAAPRIAIRVVGHEVGRVPLGDTIVLVADVTDPDGEALGADALRWYLGDPVDDPYREALSVGDTLRFAVGTVGALQFHLRVTDEAGAYADEWYATAAFDPRTRARWRTRVANYGASAVARQPSGLIIVAVPYSTVDPVFPAGTRMVTALTDEGAWVWTVDTRLDEAPIVIGDDGGAYQGGGYEGNYPRAETRLVKLGSDGGELWSLSDAAAIGGPAILLDRGLAIPRLRGFMVAEPDGAQRWSVAFDSLDLLRGLSVGADSTLYAFVLTPSPTSRASVLAYDPSGVLRWRVFLGSAATANAVFPANDSTLIVAADSIHALRADGSVRWSQAGRFWHPAVGVDRLYYVLENWLVAVALVDGSEAWRVPLPPGAAGAPLLTAKGEVVAASGSTILAFDAATGAEQWRHEMAGALSAPMLLTQSGDLILADGAGYIESLPLGAGAGAGSWPMGWADERRTGRARRP